MSTAPARRTVPSDLPTAALAPGVPGTPNCQGQTERFVAQGDGGLADSQGIGGLSSLSGYSVQDLKTFIAQYCAGQ